MTPDQRQAILAVGKLATGERRLSLADFPTVTGIDEPSRWAREQLEDALEHRDADDVALAMMVGFAFGMDRSWVVPLIRVLEADWTISHEDAAHELGFLEDSRAVPALVRVAYWVPEYLDYDEARALAVKAIHSLGRIPGPEAEAALRGLLDHEDRPLRPRVERVLQRRRAAQAGKDPGGSAGRSDR